MVIGITGGVGCGKSTVMALLQEEYGAKILIADEIGHLVMEKGRPAYDEIRRTFGGGVIKQDGSIDREALSGIVYGDEEKLALLNGIVHPRVREEIRTKLLAWKEEPLIVLETAILFETGCDTLCDEVWAVVTGREIRIERLISSRGYTREKAESIMAKQLGEEQFLERCGRIIQNNGDLEMLKQQLRELMTHYID